MKRSHRPRPPHRRDWRRLWRYCRCGYRWRCPDSVELVPRPYEPTVPPLDRVTYRRSVELSAVAAAPPARVWAGNQRPVRRESGRNARLAVAPAARSRSAGRVPG